MAEGSSHVDRFSVEVRDAADESSWGPPDPGLCFILGTEVLDNCPHDKYALHQPLGKFLCCKYMRLGEAHPKPHIFLPVALLLC